jgi:ParB family chromosome partitioning protein
MGHARALLALEQDDDILEAREEVLKKQLSVRECEALVKKIKSFGRVAKAPSAPEPDPNLLHLEEALKQVLGTQSKILPKGKGGKIEISYYSAAELDRILELLGAI